MGLVTDLLFDRDISFWPGWKAIHSDFSTIPTATSEEWKADGFWTNFSIRFDQWVNPIFAVAFFLLFGFTEQKRAWYRSLFWKIMQPLGFKPRVNPVASDIVFGSGPMVNSAMNDTRGTVMWVFMSLL